MVFIQILGLRRSGQPEGGIDNLWISGETPLRSWFFWPFVMPRHPMSTPDPSNNVSPIEPPEADGTPPPPRTQLDDSSFETDFADLASRFAAKSGGGLSPELSADLALEIVLNEIVEQACLATGATGAAIVLLRDGEMVCRATSGTTAPELGARLDANSGISGECLRSLTTLRSDDVQVDPHADVEASKRLGVRSVIVMPLMQDSELLGVFEILSSRARAFSERDEGTLEVLVGRTLSNLDNARRPLELQTTRVLEPASEETIEEILGESSDQVPQKRFDYLTASLAVAVVLCTLLLGVLVGRRFIVHGGARARSSSRALTVNAATRPADSGARNAAGGTTTSAVSNQGAQIAANPAGAQGPGQPPATAKSKGSSISPGGLLVYDNGKEVFRMPPPKNSSGDDAEQGSGMEQAASVEPEEVEQVTPQAAENSLVHRVEPLYPEEARTQGIQGPVVLEVHIGADGTVQDVQVVNGAPLLAQASTAAVQQWRFKPHMRNGRAVEMQTQVTLNFRLPQQ